MIEHNFKTKIYYKDVDLMGITYYSRYLEFFEQARTELLNSLSLNVSDIENLGFYLPVITAHCEYKISTKFEDKIIVKSQISENPKLKLKIDYKITKNKSNQIVVSGYTHHVFMNKDSKVIRVPDFIKNILKKRLIP